MRVQGCLLGVLIAILIALLGCTAAPDAGQAPVTEMLRPERPEDLSNQILDNDLIPERFKRNYCDWLRYAYDQESKTIGRAIQRSE